MPSRVIKKYANRRLYDVETSRYITQSELNSLIVGGASVQVLDARTGDDRTREVLLQIVAEQEQLGMPLLSEAMLVALIRFYGHPLQQMASRYLEASLGRLVAQSRDVAERMQRATLSPAEFMQRLAQGSLDWLQPYPRGASSMSDDESRSPTEPEPKPRARRKKKK